MKNIQHSTCNIVQRELLVLSSASSRQSSVAFRYERTCVCLDIFFFAPFATQNKISWVWFVITSVDKKKQVEIARGFSSYKFRWRYSNSFDSSSECEFKSQKRQIRIQQVGGCDYCNFALLTNMDIYSAWNSLSESEKKLNFVCDVSQKKIAISELNYSSAAQAHTASCDREVAWNVILNHLSLSITSSSHSRSGKVCLARMRPQDRSVGELEIVQVKCPISPPHISSLSASSAPVLFLLVCW